MIKVTNMRTRGNEPPFDPGVYDRTVSLAFEQLALYEIGYGGVITDLKETSITIKTRVLEKQEVVPPKHKPNHIGGFICIASHVHYLLNSIEGLETRIG